MGTIVSSINNSVDVFKMNTFDEIDFQDHLRQQFETARAAGRQEQLTQVQRAGGFGGIGFAGGTGFNTPATFWYTLGSILGGRFIAPAMFVIFGIMFAVFYIGKSKDERNQGMIFLTSFFAIFGLMNLFIFHTETGLKSMTTPGPLIGSLGVSLAASTVITFVA